MPPHCLPVPPPVGGPQQGGEAMPSRRGQHHLIPDQEKTLPAGEPPYCLDSLSNGRSLSSTFSPCLPRPGQPKEGRNHSGSGVGLAAGIAGTPDAKPPSPKGGIPPGLTFSTFSNNRLNLLQNSVVRWGEGSLPGGSWAGGGPKISSPVPPAGELDPVNISILYEEVAGFGDLPSGGLLLITNAST